MRTKFLFFLFLLCLSGMASAQSTGHGQATRLSNGQLIPVDGTPTGAQAAGPPQKAVGMRPADDSDPKMQALWFEIVHTPDCDTPLVLCEPRLGKVKGGGDRLAEYLIRQYEISKAEGKGSADSYLRLLGATGDRGVNYLLEKARAPETLQIGLEGLLFAADPRAMDTAAEVLWRDDPSLGTINTLAVSVLRVNMITTSTVREGDVSLLRRLEKGDNRRVDVRPHASRTLKDLEKRGLLAVDPNYPHPADLEAWVPNPVRYQ